MVTYTVLLELGVLLGVTAGLLDGVLALVDGDLGAQRLLEVDVQHVREAEQVAEDVGHLLANPIGPTGSRHDVAGLLGGEPLEEFCEFPDFTHERQDKTFGVVKLVPIACGSEGGEFFLEALDTHAYTLSGRQDPERGPPESRRDWGVPAGGRVTVVMSVVAATVRRMMKRSGALVAAVMMVLSGCASTSGSVDESDPEGSNAGGSSEGGGGEAEAKPDPKFGQTYTWPGGLSVRVSRPKPFAPSEYASFDKAPNYREFEITLINKTGAKVDGSIVYLTVQSGDQEMTEVFDSEKGLNGTPSTPLLDGRQARWRTAFGVKNPRDIVLQFNPNVYEPEVLEPVVYVQG